MALGYHKFYAFSGTDHTRKARGHVLYFLGAFLGDTFKDPDFKDKIDRILARLTQRFGISNYSYYWSPYYQKPYQPRTMLQKYRTSVRKAENKHQKAVAGIFLKYPLFADFLVLEQEAKLKDRIEVLKSRYQINTDLIT